MPNFKLEDLRPPYQQQAREQTTEQTTRSSVPHDAYMDAWAKNVKEKQFQEWVNATFNRAGWLVYHTLNSKGSAKGFPDLVASSAARGRIVFAELKSRLGRVTPEQHEWITSLKMNSSGAPWITVHVWRPSDWREITNQASEGTTLG